jgi:hypothetical protein
MKYYSEKLNKMYDSAEELGNAETAYDKAQKEKEAKAVKLRDERAARAKEVEDAFTAANEAYKKANDLMNKFLADYGKFHTTITESVPNLWDSLWNLVF